ncbi:restriction endonuclease [Lysobacter humi (ex Lee et al. 2017)]
MTPVAALIIGLLLAAIAAAVWAGYLWRIRRPHEVTREGLKILSAMRWRELSNLIVDALGASGFERESAESRAARGAQGDVVLHREGRPWLLQFRQGLANTIGRDAVEDFVRQIRVHQAGGGLLITLGRVEPSAREVVANIELVDGDGLWKLVEPRLPASVLSEVEARAQARTLRGSAVALAVSTIAGLALAWLLVHFVAEPEVGAVPDAALSSPRPRTAAAPADTAEKPIVVPRSEEEQRVDLAHQIATLPGVDRAVWSTRSTLQIFITDPELATDERLCAVMMPNELLRASRLQLQNPPESGVPVRFKQCASY